MSAAPDGWTDERRELLELLMAQGPVTLGDVRMILGKPDPGLDEEVTG